MLLVINGTMQFGIQFELDAYQLANEKKTSHTRQKMFKLWLSINPKSSYEEDK